MDLYNNDSHAPHTNTLMLSFDIIACNLYFLYLINISHASEKEFFFKVTKQKR